MPNSYYSDILGKTITPGQNKLTDLAIGVPAPQAGAVPQPGAIQPGIQQMSPSTQQVTPPSIQERTSGTIAPVLPSAPLKDTLRDSLQSAGLELDIGRRTAEASLPTFEQSQLAIRNLMETYGGMDLTPEKLDVSGAEFAMPDLPGVIDPNEVSQVGFRDPQGIRDAGLVSSDPAAVSRAARLAGDAAQKQISNIRRSASGLGAAGGQMGAALGGAGNLAAMAASRAAADEAARQGEAGRREVLGKQQTLYQQDLANRSDIISQMRAKQQAEYDRLAEERSRRIQEEYALRDTPLSTMLQLLQFPTKSNPSQVNLPTSSLIANEASSRSNALAAQQIEAQRDAERRRLYSAGAGLLSDYLDRR